jgi:CheY-like chemotaxis protein
VPNAHPPKTILVVDDDRGFLDSLAAGLSEAQGHAILTANDGDEAIALLESTPVDLVVTDLRMPGVNGFDLVDHLTRNHPSIPAIVMTAFGTAEMEEDFDALGVRAYVEKPIDLGQLASKIESALDPGASLPGARAFPRSAETLRAALESAAEGRLDGEVIVRRGVDYGRTFFVAGQVAWAVASTTGQTLMSLLTERTDLGAEDLRGVFEECRRTGRNFAQTLVEWGLLGEDTVRALLLEHVAVGVARMLTWRDADVMVVPEKRTYGSSLLFALGDVLDAAHAPFGTERLRAMADAVMSPATGPSRLQPPAAEVGPPSIGNDGKEDVMQAQKIRDTLETLRGVDGFIGVAAFIPTGEVVAEISAGGAALSELGALANDVLLKSQKATEIMGVGRGNQIQVAAPKANILVRCLNENTDFAANEPGRAHVHMMLILHPEGNLALGKIQLEKVIQQVAPFLR